MNILHLKKSRNHNFCLRYDQEDSKQRTPLHLAAVRGNSTCARLLMDAGCLLEARDVDGDTPLHKAASGNGLQTAKGDRKLFVTTFFLCQFQFFFFTEILNNDDVVDVNAVNGLTGATSLHYASTTAMAALLMDAGADPSIKMKPKNGNGEGKSAFAVFLETMPEGCNVILNSFLKTNGKSPVCT